MDRNGMLIESAKHRFDANVDRTSLAGCWPWTGGLNQFGYGRFRVAGRMVLASVFAWEQATGELPAPGLRVCHTCDERSCVRDDDHGIYVVRGESYERRGHLWLGSQLANMRDASDKRRIHGWPRIVGERASRARLTTANVLAIRQRHVDGDSYMTLAREFGVGKTTIEALVTRRSWAHV